MMRTSLLRIPLAFVLAAAASCTSPHPEPIDPQPLATSIVPTAAYDGVQTARAVENFQISG